MELTAEEANLVKALRRLRAAEAAQPPAAPEMLEHGYVTKRRAAELLGVEPKEFERLTGRTTGRFGRQLPVVDAGPNKGRVPLSELRIEARLLWHKHLEQLAQVAVELVTKNQRKHTYWHATPAWTCSEDLRLELSGWDVDGVARELEVSVAEARRLMGTDGPLFTHVTRRGLRIVRPVELDAYKRKLQLSRPATLTNSQREEIHESRVARVA
jgi:hypothetical protein